MLTNAGRPHTVMMYDKDRHPYFYVRLTRTVWPEIYKNARPYAFPTRESAIRFAKSNLSGVISNAVVLAPDQKTVIGEYSHPLVSSRDLHLL